MMRIFCLEEEKQEKYQFITNPQASSTYGSRVAFAETAASKSNPKPKLLVYSPTFFQLFFSVAVQVPKDMYPKNIFALLACHQPTQDVFNRLYQAFHCPLQAMKTSIMEIFTKKFRIHDSNPGSESKYANHCNAPLSNPKTLFYFILAFAKDVRG